MSEMWIGQDRNKSEQIDESRNVVALAGVGPAETEMDMIKMWSGHFCVRILFRK